MRNFQSLVTSLHLQLLVIAISENERLKVTMEIKEKCQHKHWITLEWNTTCI